MLCRGHLICLLPVCPCCDAVIQGPSRGQGAGLSFKTLVMGGGLFSNMPVGPKHHLIHSHKQEVDGVLAAHRHRLEDRDLKVLA